MQAEIAPPDLLACWPAVVGDDTQEGLGCFCHYRGILTKAKDDHGCVRLSDLF